MVAKHRLGKSRTATSLLALVAAFGMASCGSFDDGGSEPLETLDTLEEPYFYSAPLPWAPVVQVCWEQDGLTVEKGWIREAVKGQRSWEQFGDITLAGWGTCPANFSLGIRINLAEQLANSEVGRPTDGVVLMKLDVQAGVEGRWGQCTSNGLDAEDCIKAVAIHEFGHALGASHEQDRPENGLSCFPCNTNADCTANNGGGTCINNRCMQSNGQGIPFSVWDNNSIMNYCANPDPTDLSALDRKGFEFFHTGANRDPQRLHDTNGDGSADLICHDAIDGTKWVDYANASGQFNGTNWSRNGGWCGSPTNRLFKGDFDGNTRIDLLCHDVSNGNKFIDYASSTGRYEGTDWSTSSNFCLAGRKLYIGDFNGDGRDDMLCHDPVQRTMFMDLADASGRFGTTEEFAFLSATCPFQSEGQGRFYVGNYNGGPDDILCIEENGNKTMLFGGTDGRFSGGSWSQTSTWCAHDTGDVLIGDFNGDTLDDLLCHDVSTGRLWIDYASSTGRFSGTDWQRSANFCTAPFNRLFVGDVNNAGGDDLLCHAISDGDSTTDSSLKQVDYADDSGRFLGVDWSTDIGWCHHASGEVH